MKIEIADQVMIQILKTRATESPLSDVAESLPMNVN